MKVFRTLLSVSVGISCFFASTEAKKKDEEKNQAMRDMQSGMAGLKEAANNPAMLAQLMRDLAVSDVVFASLCCERVNIRCNDAPFHCGIFHYLLTLSSTDIFPFLGS